MKKILAALLTALVLSTSAVLAEPNDSFADVSTNHWAFEAVNQLAKDGIINGNNGKFNGDNTMTRYEMAKIVAEALAKYEKADAKNKAMLDKLKSEFAPELGSLDLQIGELEKVDSGFKVSTEVRVRYAVNTVENDKLNYNKKTKRILKNYLLMKVFPKR